MNYIISILLALLPYIACSQIDSTRLITDGYFISPVDHTMKLAGSFGELRSNHFHSGIDIKSKKGAEGDTIRCAADGYISRIKLQRGSYGKVVYIDHPNGFTTVYAHMQRFSPEIESYIRERQKAVESYEVELFPSADKFQLEQGQPIGHLGNTGRSYGPHLHFEIRNTVTEIPQNPYLHGIGPEDEKNPLLYAVSVQGMDRDLIEVSDETKYINLTKGNKEMYGPIHKFEVPAWRAAVSIQAFDLMDGAANKNGLYHLKMYVDDTLHYEMKMDSVGWDETKYINSFIEYEEKKVNTRTLIRCYKQKNNPLSLYRTIRNNGFFKVFKNKARKIRFEAIDFYGNRSISKCEVLRREQVPSDVRNTTFSKKIKYNQAYDFKLGVTHMSIPKGITDNTLLLEHSQGKNAEGELALRLGHSYQPLFDYMSLTLPLSSVPPDLRSKAVLVYISSKTPTSFGGTVIGDSLAVKVNKLGKFLLTTDETPPTITPLEYKKDASLRKDFKFRLKDNFNTRGAAKDITYDVYIDGVWTICPLKALGDLLTIPLEGIPSGDHFLQITATDHSGNSTNWKGSFFTK